MSHDPEFLTILHVLEHDADPSARAEAATVLGNFVNELNDDEYKTARSALNKALTDPDPMVLMAAMSAMTKYDRQGASALIEDEEEELSPISGQGATKAAACTVCGRPEALIPDGGCERDDCPYA